jgi:NAD(P)-dependent dehydrogenase (short-subunit alcohol dehydrogenase family)
MDRLSGRVAIVTGGATGLGRSVACLYAEEGAKVVIGDVDVEEAQQTVQLIHDAGGEALFVPTDISEGAQVRRLVDTAEEQFGAVHVMTANAGVLGPGPTLAKQLVDMTEEQFMRVINVNLAGTCWSFKYAIPAILRAGGGAMTATAALAAHVGYAGLAGYSASKGGICALARCLAAELEGVIRVNVVSGGGGTESQLGRRTGASFDPQAWGSVKKTVRDNDPREVANAHLFLASDESSYVNGQVIVADLGLTILAQDWP